MSESKAKDFSFAKGYAKFRPEYPSHVFAELMKRHQGGRELAVDLGAGTGQASFSLAKLFDRVIATDPSQNVQTSTVANLQFFQGTSEKIDLPDGSVDMLVSAQAAHWFDLPKFWPEAARVLRPDGTLCLWGYSMCELDHLAADKLLSDYYWNIIGPFWDAPRKLVDRRYADIVPDGTLFNREERVSTSMEKTVTVNDLVGYLDTWSGLHEYRKQKKEDPLPAMEQRLVQAIGGNEKQVKLTWPVFMVFAWKK